MPASVPTTRPPRGRNWYRWADHATQGGRPWMFERVVVWRPGWRDVRVIEPKATPAGHIMGLHWTPAGRRLTETEIVQRLMRQARDARR